MRSLRRGLLAVMVTAGSLSPPASVGATSVDDQRAEVERIVDELDRLQREADVLAEDYAVAVDEMRRLDGEIIEAEAEVAAQQRNLDELRDDLADVAIRSFTGSGVDVLGPLFSGTTAQSDALRRDQYARVALSTGTATTDDLEQSVADLSDAKDVLDAKQAEAETLALAISRAQGDAVARTAEYEAARSDAEAKLGDLIEAEEERRAAAAFAQLQASTTASTTAATPPTSSSDDGRTESGSNATSAEPAPAATTSENNGSAGEQQDLGEGGNGDGETSTTGPAENSDAEPSGGADDASDNDNQADARPADPPVSGLAGVAIQAALDQLGVPYKYATSLPGVSFDCSGLTHYAWGQAGVYLPRNSRAQQASVPNVPIASAQPGDLLFYYSPISHVGIYLGGGQLVHAPNSGTTVKVANVSWDKVTAVARPG